MATTIAILMRTAILALLWWMLAATDAQSWLFGAPAIVAIVAWRSMRLGHTRYQLRLVGLARFIPYFFWRSFLGGCDVAWRTFHPRLPIQPTMARYPLRLPTDSPARVLMANTINLLPGTATAALDNDAMTVHVLTATPNIMPSLEELEIRVARVFGHRLRSPAGEQA